MTPRGYGPDASFCPRCGGRLPAAPPTSCPGCGYQLFVNARPTVGLIVLDDSHGRTRFLTLLRAAEPMAGRWEMPGGFCDGWEHPADAAVREAREELGVEIRLGDFVGMYLGDYDFQGERLPVLDSYYLATLPDGEISLNPAESADLAWYDLVDPPPLAFATMDAAVRDAARQLGLRSGLGS
ncbi:NUDIX domain-containing protein [Micromonospora sp. NPDC049559]|uniref:NUDIX domain-containing protein n=1 Tax=Micromonospora sp. NPDC049559 TaxID=3155923 RepID=UPI00342B6115